MPNLSSSISNPSSDSNPLSLKQILILVGIGILILLIIILVVCHSSHQNKLSAENVIAHSIPTQSSHVQSYGTLDITKKEFQKISYKQIQSFFNWTEDTKDYQYIVVTFEDSTALVCKDGVITYGILDSSTNALSPQFGVVKDMGNYYSLANSHGQFLSYQKKHKGINGLVQSKE